MISSRLFFYRRCLLETVKYISFSVNCGIKVQEQKMGEGINRLHDMRQPYNSVHEVFDVNDLISKEPYENFRAWFEEARNCKSIYEPNAMALATATKDGKPSVRMVLMKGFDRSGVKFFTNFNSRKGQELEENPVASVMFFWDALKKVVRIEGNVVKLSDEEADEYFHTRPRESQLSACASDQSSVIASREVLTAKKAELAELYKDESVPVPKPPVWGGYLLQPDRFEFWQGQSDRLHDRIVFRRQVPGEVIDMALTHPGENGWFYERLSP